MVASGSFDGSLSTAPAGSAGTSVPNRAATTTAAVIERRCLAIG